MISAIRWSVASEDVLKIMCAPITWPIGSSQNFKGVYHLMDDETILYKTGQGHRIQDREVIKGLDNPELDARIGDYAADLREQIELVKGASNKFDKELFLAGDLRLFILVPLWVIWR